MLDIMPKINDQMIGLYAIKKYITKYRKIEIELTKGDYGKFDLEGIITKFIDVLPNLKEITIRPRGNTNAFENFFYHKESLIKHIEMIKELSRENKITINIVFPIESNIRLYKDILYSDIKEILNLIKGYKVHILLENRVFIREDVCTPLEICKFFGDEQLLTCFNIKNTYKRSLLLSEDFKSYTKKYIHNNEKYIYQIHFSPIDKDIHENLEELQKDFMFLKEFHLNEKLICIDVKEIHEQDKIEEVKELEFLEKIGLQK